MLDRDKTHQRTARLEHLQVRIFLDRSSYEYLIKHLAHGSKSLSILDKSVLLGNTRIVECTATEANKLLRDAIRDWPDAVSRILEGIRAVGLNPQNNWYSHQKRLSPPADQLRLTKNGSEVVEKIWWPMTKHTNGISTLFFTIAVETFRFQALRILDSAIRLGGC